MTHTSLKKPPTGTATCSKLPHSFARLTARSDLSTQAYTVLQTEEEGPYFQDHLKDCMCSAYSKCHLKFHIHSELLHFSAAGFYAITVTVQQEVEFLRELVKNVAQLSLE